MKTEKYGFTPISKDEFIKSYLANNPGTDRKEIESAIERSLELFREGGKCSCGNPIWVVGSAVAGTACFTCITGESKPDDDYEIEEAI